MTNAPLKSTFPWQGLVMAIIIVGYLVLACLIPPGADTLWRLHIARGLLDGQTLYKDLIEINPPLWFWAAMPAALFGGYPALVAINLGVSVIGLGLFGALARLTLRSKEQPHVDPIRDRTWTAIIALAAGLLLVNVAEIGQREQAFLLASALWSALAAARIENKAVPLWLALLATCFCAYGFALKHYFVLVPVGVEIMVLLYKKRDWRPFRPENLLLGVLAIAYGVGVIYVTPDFLKRIPDLVEASYYGFGPWNGLGPVERQIRLLLQCLFIVVPLIGLFLTRNTTVLEKILMLVLLITIAIIMFQQKGWRYHIIAAYGLSILASALICQSLLRPGAARVPSASLFMVVGIGLLVNLAIFKPSITNLRTNGQPITPVLTNMVANVPRSHHIVILSTAPDQAFFATARVGRPHWSRHFSMWMMPGLMTPQVDARRETLRRVEYARVLNEFTSDVMCRPPNLIIGEIGFFRNPEIMSFNAMKFLREDRAFRVWMDAHYRSEPKVGVFPIWRLIGAKPEPSNCTKRG